MRDVVSSQGIVAVSSLGRQTSAPWPRLVRHCVRPLRHAGRLRSPSPRGDWEPPSAGPPRHPASATKRPSTESPSAGHAPSHWSFGRQRLLHDVASPGMHDSADVVGVRRRCRSSVGTDHAKPRVKSLLAPTTSSKSYNVREDLVPSCGTCTASTALRASRRPDRGSHGWHRARQPAPGWSRPGVECR